MSLISPCTYTAIRVPTLAHVEVGIFLVESISRVEVRLVRVWLEDTSSSLFQELVDLFWLPKGFHLPLHCPSQASREAIRDEVSPRILTVTTSEPH